VFALLRMVKDGVFDMPVFVINGVTCDTRKAQVVARYEYTDAKRDDVTAEVYQRDGELFTVATWQELDPEDPRGDPITKTTVELTDKEEIEEMMARGAIMEVLRDGVFTLQEDRGARDDLPLGEHAT
jgi:hypothetical protein